MLPGAASRLGSPVQEGHWHTEVSPTKPTKLIRVLANMTCKERLRELGLLILEMSQGRSCFLQLLVQRRQRIAMLACGTAPGQYWWQRAMAEERTCWCQSRQPWLAMGSEMWSAEGGMSRAAEAGFSATGCSGWA